MRNRDRSAKFLRAAEALADRITIFEVFLLWLGYGIHSARHICSVSVSVNICNCSYQVMLDFDIVIPPLATNLVHEARIIWTASSEQLNCGSSFSRERIIILSQI